CVCVAGRTCGRFRNCWATRTFRRRRSTRTSTPSASERSTGRFIPARRALGMFAATRGAAWSCREGYPGGRVPESPGADWRVEGRRYNRAVGRAGRGGPSFHVHVTGHRGTARLADQWVCLHESHGLKPSDVVALVAYGNKLAGTTYGACAAASPFS